MSAPFTSNLHRLANRHFYTRAFVWAGTRPVFPPSERAAGSCGLALLERATGAAVQMWQIAFVIAVLASIFLLRLYAEKGTPVAIMIPVLISWSLGFFFFLVLPFDLEHALCRKCRESRLTQEEKDGCACLAGDGGMGIDQLRDLIPAAYTCVAPHEPQHRQRPHPTARARAG